MKLESDTGEVTMYVSSKGGEIEKITKLKKEPVLSKRKWYLWRKTDQYENRNPRHDLIKGIATQIEQQ